MMCPVPEGKDGAEGKTDVSIEILVLTAALLDKGGSREPSDVSMIREIGDAP